MPNLRPPAARTDAPIPYSFLPHARLTRHGARRARVNIGADYVDPEYLAPSRVATRRAQLVADGYRPDLATLAVRLEGRENTLLDTDAEARPGLTDAEERELAAVQTLLSTFHTQARAGWTA